MDNVEYYIEIHVDFHLNCFNLQRKSSTGFLLPHGVLRGFPREFFSHGQLLTRNHLQSIVVVCSHFHLPAITWFFFQCHAIDIHRRLCIMYPLGTIQTFFPLKKKSH